MSQQGGDPGGRRSPLDSGCVSGISMHAKSMLIMNPYHRSALRGAAMKGWGTSGLVVVDGWQKEDMNEV